MSISINSGMNPFRTANKQNTINFKRQSAIESEVEMSKDKISISEEGKKLQHSKAKKTSDGLEILQTNSETGEYGIRFKNLAYVYQAIERGSVTVNGNEIILDDETKGKLKETADQVFKTQEAANAFAVVQHNALVAEQQGEAMSESMKEEQKLLEIASRIMKGGKVPEQDLKKLAEGNPELYSIALAIATMNKNKEKKEYKSVDEEKPQKENDGYGSDPENNDTPMDHIDRHYVDIGVSIGAGGGYVDSVSAEVVDMG